jgi:hypothetical protein
MPLAAIIGIWVLLATPSAGGAWGASAPGAQDTSTQDSQTAPAQQETPPNSESKPATEPSPQQNAPSTGGEKTTKPQEGEASPTEPPKASPPAQEPAPENVQPSPSPEQPKTAEPESKSASATTKSATSKTSTATTASKTSAARTRKRRKRKATAHAAPTAPTKTVVRNGSTGEPTVQLSPGLSQQQASSQRQNTTQLLANADANLKKIAAQQLSASQQDTAKQIRQYVQQANTAVAAGDLERGHNLAVKANLLSEELVKH